jgi:metallo-beta-lactamase family protein
MDSVYGNKNHESKEKRDDKFRQIVSDSIKKKGTLIIPAFSMERTQVILYELNNLVEKGKIKSVPVYLDSPLAERVTKIYRKYPSDFNGKIQKQIRGDDDIFRFPKLEIVHGMKESQSIDGIPGPKIIIAGSGMSTGGRIVGHEVTYLPDPKATILLAGYQAVGTLGRKIQEVPLFVEIYGNKIPIKAKVEMIAGYSSHKDSDHLLDMVSDTARTLKKVFVTMGEPASSLYLVQHLRDQLGIDALYPERGRSYELK